jgi:ABC-type multidrug transport system fused ATPase/permease subunit
LSEIDLSAWRRSIGYVPQEPLLFEDSVANNVSLWRCDPAETACRAQIEDAARKAHCDEFVRLIPGGYLGAIGERGATVSGGQRQRLAIARELFKRPQLLILDEATSALDSESEASVRRSLDELRGSTTVIVIAHRLSTIRNSDLVVVLQAGRILESGSFAELVSREGSRLSELARQQSVQTS